MKIKRIFKDPMNKERRTFFEQRKWFFYSWEFIIIIIVTMIAALMNQMPNWVGETHKIYFADGAGGHDYYIANTLVDNIIYAYITLGITVAASIFIGVYNVLGNFIGKSSSALFILVPSIVWLLTTTENNHISNIIEINNSIYTFCFWLTVGLVSFYFLIVFVRKVVINYIYGFETRRLIEVITNALYRINIVFINIAVLFILSSCLVNFGIFTLHLTDIPLSEQKAAIESPDHTIIGQYNIDSQSLKTYIAIITLLFAMLMVSIGLTVTLVKRKHGDELELSPEEMAKRRELHEEKMQKTRTMLIQLDNEFLNKERQRTLKDKQKKIKKKYGGK